MSMISDQLQALRDDIERVCRQAGRSVDDVVLVGVTKYTDADSARQAVDAGLAHLGENRVQDAAAKFEALGDLSSVTKHLLGPLQSNKAKQAVELFDMIQSVERVKIIRAIEKHAKALGRVMDVLIQVNVAGEEQKSGCAPEEVEQLLNAVEACSYVRVKGFMTMAPLTNDESVLRQCFSGLRTIFNRALQERQDSKNIEMAYLSMGMSGDYRIALEEGANMLRIGSKIFK